MSAPALRLALAIALIAVTPAAAADNPWLGRRVLNIAHQGGENEAPSNTFYAYDKALANGADVLEIDVNITKDGVPVVMHDTHLGRMCHREINVNDITLAQLKTYDAACTWPEYKGIATGDKEPPPGFTADDFKVHTLEEFLRRYDDVLANIEIKGPAPDTVDAQAFWQQESAGKNTALENAVAMADVINRFHRDHAAIVVSFSDLATEIFKQHAPTIDTATGLETTAAFYATTGAGTPLPGAPNPQHVALEPPTYFGGIEVPTADFVADAHANGFAVHVWTDSDADETPAKYRSLIANGVDGVMTNYPSVFEATLKPDERYVSPEQKRMQRKFRPRKHRRAARRAR